MINNGHAVNSSGDVATLSGDSEKVSRHLVTNQSAAMNAAVLIGIQYSPESKSQFRRECLDHLKASLASARNVSA
jgi:hypothetical protein